MDVSMQTIGQNYIDYWQCFYVGRQGLKNRFGLRVRDGRCWALIQIGDKDDPFTFGQPYYIPVDLSMLPSYLRMMVNDHQLNYPSSDLAEVLAGKKSFHSILDSPAKIGPKRTTATEKVRLPHAS